MKYEHIPVLLDEVIKGLNVKEDGIYFDGTLGGGGHSKEILKRLTTGKLIATDKDLDAIAYTSEAFKPFGEKVTIIHDDFKEIIPYLEKLNITGLDGILLDLGISSYQIDTPERGFSYIKDAPLDMRMDKEQRLSAYEVVNEYSPEALVKILFEYGEENFARQIVRKLCERRKVSPIQTTLELAGIVESCFPARVRFKFGHPAKRTFQAIRIEVNNELRDLSEFLSKIALKLNKGGRMCVITFHSLEDRIVKHAFKDLETDCICDKNLPICVCNKRKEVEILTKKPLLGSELDIGNKRAESAKLRIVERV